MRSREERGNWSRRPPGQAPCDPFRDADRFARQGIALPAGSSALRMSRRHSRPVPVAGTGGCVKKTLRPPCRGARVGRLPCRGSAQERRGRSRLPPCPPCRWRSADGSSGPWSARPSSAACFPGWRSPSGPASSPSSARRRVSLAAGPRPRRHGLPRPHLAPRRPSRRPGCRSGQPSPASVSPRRRVARGARRRAGAGPPVIAPLTGLIEALDEREEGARLIVRVESFGSLTPEARPQRVRVSFRKAPPLRPGDHLAATARLLPPPRPPGRGATTSPGTPISRGSARWAR